MKKLAAEVSLTRVISGQTYCGSRRFGQSFDMSASLENPALNSRLARNSLAKSGLRSSKTRDRHAIGRARYVIESDLMAERD